MFFPSIVSFKFYNFILIRIITLMFLSFKIIFSLCTPCYLLFIQRYLFLVWLLNSSREFYENSGYCLKSYCAANLYLFYNTILIHCKMLRMGIRCIWLKDSQVSHRLLVQGPVRQPAQPVTEV
jgi:hypothetical protein